MEKYYLKISTAKDLKDKKERILYRFFEILPGATSYLVLFLAVILSFKKPIFVAFFIIIYDLYWVCRSIYLSFHLQSGYKKMKEHEKIDWKKLVEAIPGWEKVYHLIILPMYKEPYEVVRGTFLSLKNSDYPKDKMIVVLGCEERAKDYAQSIAEKIQKEFGNIFFKLLITWHPAGLENEIPGHGSNDAWACKTAKEKIIDFFKIPYQNIVVSSFDVDTCPFPKYFSCLTYHYLTVEKPCQSSYQPIPLYVNNIWQAPSISRVFSFSSTFWHTMNQERPEKLITFSSHAISFKALNDVGFKMPNVISDDSRIFWQCFFYYDGDYKVEPIFYPVSMDANCSNTLWQTMINIYKQQKRWAYGVGEVPYFLFGFLKNKKIPLAKKISLGFEVFESHISWATSSILIFLLGWLPLILGGDAFSQTLVSYNLPRLTGLLLTIAMLGLISSVFLSMNLLPPKPVNYGKSKYLILALEWLLIPITMIFFTSFPALDAQTHWMLGKYMGFWVTPKIRK